jgi:outer membrane biosynthesis protein TonB
MTQPTEPAKTDKQTTAPVGGSPKPTPAVAAKPSDTPPGASPKPKPAVAAKPASAPAASSPKPKPAVAGTQKCGGARLAPFETYTRAGIASGSAKAAPDDSDMRSRPVAKTRMLNIFPGGTPKL